MNENLYEPIIFTGFLAVLWFIVWVRKYVPCRFGGYHDWKVLDCHEDDFELYDLKVCLRCRKIVDEITEAKFEQQLFQAKEESREALARQILADRECGWTKDKIEAMLEQERRGF